MATQSIQITAEPRSGLGSRANKRLRGTGKVPGVVYGHKEAVVPVTLPKKELVNHLNKGAHVFDLNLDGKAEKVLVKEVQYDHLGIELIHVDFARVSLDEKVKITVPLELKGFDAVVFDPPRQGALAQARELAASKVPVVIAVSCDAETFARDASILADGGYRLDAVTPVDQFRYSAHIEIVARFQKR